MKRLFTSRIGKPPQESGSKVELSFQAIADGHHKVTYRGLTTIRSPFDYLIYQMILFEIEPDLIIEIGTHIGGNALYLADLLNIIGNGCVHSIDIRNKSADIVRQHPRIKLYTSGWKK